MPEFTIGDTYYTPEITNGLPEVKEFIFQNFASDNSRIAANIACETFDEATRKADTMLLSAVSGLVPKASVITLIEEVKHHYESQRREVTEIETRLEGHSDLSPLLSFVLDVLNKLQITVEIL